MIRFYFQFFLFFFLIFSFLFLASAGVKTGLDLSSSAQAQTKTEPDALAVRVLPNVEHVDPLRWYKDKGFEGDPDRLTVDGYNAVRDGRTVYVNVGNINENEFDEDEFYTNIFILSYTQEATANTVEIFNRLLKNVEFNTNLMEDESDLGYCSISTINCVEDEDCASDYKCSDNWKCVPEEEVRCYEDSTCPENIYCDSDKSQITRNTERMAHNKEIDILAEKYNEQHGNFPKLEAGTYYAGATISVWPSWKNTFQKELSSVIGEYSVFSSLPKDPINRLSRCSNESEPRFNQTTCWDNINQEFAGIVTDEITLPTYPGSHPYKSEAKTFKSYAYTYTHGSFNLCSPLEGEEINIEGFDVGVCSPSTNISTESTSENFPPNVSCGTLSAHPGDDLTGYIQAEDPDGDNIVSWSMSGEPSWIEDRSIPMPGYREIYTPSNVPDSADGEYTFDISATDSAGNSSSRTCSIQVGNTPPTVSIPCASDIRIANEYSCSINAYDPDGDSLTYNVSGLPSNLNFSDGEISGTPTSEGSYNINVNITDPFGESDSASYTLDVNTYCGDNNVQNPNGEGANEECDY